MGTEPENGKKLRRTTISSMIFKKVIRKHNDTAVIALRAWNVFNPMATNAVNAFHKRIHDSPRSIHLKL